MPLHTRGRPSPLNPLRRDHIRASMSSGAATTHSSQRGLPLKTEDQAQRPINMARTDSGFEDGYARRSTSTSSTRRPKHSSTSRPSNKKVYKPATSSQISPTRSQHRITPSDPQMSSAETYQFFQFPSLAEPSAEHGSRVQMLQHDPDEVEHVLSSRSPPSTVNYWTSVESRRLEYAAIDAASRGIRGFVNRLLPDCILPADYKRTKFHSEDKDDDAGSVRRYRLHLPEERSKKNGNSHQEKEEEIEMESKKLGLFQRLSFGRSKTT